MVSAILHLRSFKKLTWLYVLRYIFVNYKQTLISPIHMLHKGRRIFLGNGPTKLWHLMQMKSIQHFHGQLENLDFPTPNSIYSLLRIHFQRKLVTTQSLGITVDFWKVLPILKFPLSCVTTWKHLQYVRSQEVSERIIQLNFICF